jgi:tRNA-binding protein
MTINSTDLSWEEFQRVDIRAGTIIDVQPFPEARNPAYKLKIDFGPDIGLKKSSAQITEHYTASELLAKQVICVINFPKKQIGPFMSECLVTGFYDENGKVILSTPDKTIPNGAKLG